MWMIKVNEHRTFIINCNDELRAVEIATRQYKNSNDGKTVSVIMIDWIDDADVFLGRN